MPSLEGHLVLTCAADAKGRSYLSHQSFRVPFHISKAYWDEWALIVQVINPTAGLFTGDLLQSDVKVLSGARLHITTPSASRIHTMRHGEARLRQQFQVSSGGWLEYAPAPLIPQKESRYRQSTRIEVEPDGEIFFFEVLAPGRVAHGEFFQFSEINWECDLIWGGQLIARERFRIQPEGQYLHSLRCPFPSGYYASGYLLSGRLQNDHSCWAEIDNLNTEEVMIGCSALPASGWSIKVLARDSLILSRTLRAIRDTLAKVIPFLQSSARKL